MKLPLAYYGHPILRQKTAPVTQIDENIHRLVEDMAETMEANNGCGLAAPQVHRSISLFITCVPRYLEDDTVLPGELRVFINPKIISYSREVWTYPEACLSLPGISGRVQRPVAILIQATNLQNQTFEEEIQGYDAKVCLHENDHINGVLYIDRLTPKEKKELEKQIKEIKQKYNPK